MLENIEMNFDLLCHVTDTILHLRKKRQEVLLAFIHWHLHRASIIQLKYSARTLLAAIHNAMI